jgi:group I intron endonuclease
MHSIPHESGVYQILCVPTGKVYVGSAVNLVRRWKEHCKNLRRGNHINLYLQHAWDKYGEAAFTFSVVELVPKESLLEAEQRWIDATRCYEQDRGFNICSDARSALGIKRRPETRQALSNSRSNTWEGFIDPEGNSVTITNLWVFCREHNLSFGAMYNLATGKGRIRSYKGWTHINSPYKRWYTIKYEGFIDPVGNPLPPVEDMDFFCRKHRLIPSHMYAVYHGRRRIHKGWTCIREKEEETTNE